MMTGHKNETIDPGRYKWFNRACFKGLLKKVLSHKFRSQAVIPLHQNNFEYIFTPVLNAMIFSTSP